jgi:MoxR-like ATPase
MSELQRFTGTDRYVATNDLTMAVNAAIPPARPLLLKGEPGTGKTQLAQEIARSLERPLAEWHIASTSKAQQGRYEYDAVSRLRELAVAELRRPLSGTAARAGAGATSITQGPPSEVS